MQDKKVYKGLFIELEFSEGHNWHYLRLKCIILGQCVDLTVNLEDWEEETLPQPATDRGTFALVSDVRQKNKGWRGKASWWRENDVKKLSEEQIVDLKRFGWIRPEELAIWRKTNEQSEIGFTG